VFRGRLRGLLNAAGRDIFASFLFLSGVARLNSLFTTRHDVDCCMQVRVRVVLCGLEGGRGKKLRRKYLRSASLVAGTLTLCATPRSVITSVPAQCRLILNFRRPQELASCCSGATIHCLVAAPCLLLTIFGQTPIDAFLANCAFEHIRRFPQQRIKLSLVDGGVRESFTPRLKELVVWSTSPMPLCYRNNISSSGELPVNEHGPAGPQSQQPS